MINTYIVNTDMFDSKCSILVNAVNCIGVMGAGLALQFKQRYPVMFEKYKINCNKGLLKPGGLDEHLVIGDQTVRIIVNFATKNHWKDLSEYKYIDDGMKKIVRRIEASAWDTFLFDNYSMAIPALGCGYGGLNWDLVQEIILKNLNNINTNNNWHFYLYMPQ